MPYVAGEAYSKTHKANTPKRDRQWRHVYESEKGLGRSDGKAIQMANGVLKKQAFGMAGLSSLGRAVAGGLKAPGVASRVAIGAGIGAAGGYLTKPEGSTGTGRALAGGALGALGGAATSGAFRKSVAGGMKNFSLNRATVTGKAGKIPTPVGPRNMPSIGAPRSPHVAPVAATAPAIASLPMSRRIGEAIGRGAGHTMNAPAQIAAAGKATRTNLVSGARAGIRQVRPLAPAPALEPHAFRGVGTPIGAPHAAPAAAAPVAAAPASVGTPIGAGKPSIMDRITGGARSMFASKPQPAPPVFGQTHSVPPMRGIGGGVQVQPGTGVGESGPTRLAKPMTGAGFGSPQAASAKLKGHADAQFRQSAAYRSGMASGQ